MAEDNFQIEELVQDSGEEKYIRQLLINKVYHIQETVVTNGNSGWVALCPRPLALSALWMSEAEPRAGRDAYQPLFKAEEKIWFFLRSTRPVTPKYLLTEARSRSLPYGIHGCSSTACSPFDPKTSFQSLSSMKSSALSEAFC